MTPTTLAQLLAFPTTQDDALIDERTGTILSYRGVASQVERLASNLCGAGLNPGDAVALILPNGLELLLLCLALARARLIAAPLDPASTPGELRGLIGNLQPRAIITNPDVSAAVEAGKALSLRIGTPVVDSSGVVQLEGFEAASRGTPAEPQSDDIALFLHTSGTGGAPKIVPLTHANATASATHIASHYALTLADRTLAVVPLFHGHGLIGAAFATLASGGTLVLPPRFSASRFWPSFREHRATWYTAVPTIHQILLECADRDDAPHSGPRFIRSCSAPIAPTTLRSLEQRFGAPVIEAYGLTEASHQVASNPLPPRARSAGTVGFGTGVEIGTIDALGRALPAHAEGEVVVRGPTLMHGYRNDAAASAAAFVGDWFRTGDIGFLDAKGYLTLTGRIKDLINRGGEKISPSEIEAVLVRHPAVIEAAAFGVRDPKYGEDIEAAVVVRSDTEPEALRTFCRTQLPSFKVPRMIRIVSALPRNALGKVKRHVLTERYSP